VVRDVAQSHGTQRPIPTETDGHRPTVNPATVHFRSLNEPDKLSVIDKIMSKICSSRKTASQICRKGSYADAIVHGERDHQAGRYQATLLADKQAQSGKRVWHVHPVNDVGELFPRCLLSASKVAFDIFPLGGPVLHVRSRQP